MIEAIKEFSGKCFAVGFVVGILAAGIITVATMAYAISIGIPLFPQ